MQNTDRITGVSALCLLTLLCFGLVLAPANAQAPGAPGGAIVQTPSTMFDANLKGEILGSGFISSSGNYILPSGTLDRFGAYTFDLSRALTIGASGLTLTDINDSSDVVGRWGGWNQTKPLKFHYVPGMLSPTLPTGWPTNDFGKFTAQGELIEGRATQINNQGLVIGQGRLSTGYWQEVLWDNTSNHTPYFFTAPTNLETHVTALSNVLDNPDLMHKTNPQKNKFLIGSSLSENRTLNQGNVSAFRCRVYEMSPSFTSLPQPINLPLPDSLNRNDASCTVRSVNDKGMIFANVQLWEDNPLLFRPVVFKRVRSNNPACNYGGTALLDADLCWPWRGFTLQTNQADAAGRSLEIVDVNSYGTILAQSQNVSTGNSEVMIYEDGFGWRTLLSMVDPALTASGAPLYSADFGQAGFVNETGLIGVYGKLPAYNGSATTLFVLAREHLTFSTVAGSGEREAYEDSCAGNPYWRFDSNDQGMRVGFLYDDDAGTAGATACSSSNQVTTLPNCTLGGAVNCFAGEARAVNNLGTMVGWGGEMYAEPDVSSIAMAWSKNGPSVTTKELLTLEGVDAQGNQSSRNWAFLADIENTCIAPNCSNNVCANGALCGLGIGSGEALHGVLGKIDAFAPDQPNSTAVLYNPYLDANRLITLQNSLQPNLGLTIHRGLSFGPHPSPTTTLQSQQPCLFVLGSYTNPTTGEVNSHQTYCLQRDSAAAIVRAQ